VINSETQKGVSGIDRVEGFYLRLLRGCAIVLATIMLLFAAWNGASSLFNYLQSRQSVEPAEVSVSDAEMVAAATPPKNQSDTAAPSVESERAKLPLAIYDAHAKKMFQVWKAAFEPYRLVGEAPMSYSDFSDWYQSEYINGTLRKYNVIDWVLNEDRAKADLVKSVEALSKAAQDPSLVARMKAFQTGQSTNKFWDRYDQTFMRLTDSFWLTLKVKRDAESARASARREALARKSEDAQTSFIEARNALAGFLMLMFFFLVVAMERHQRRIAAALELEIARG
jgi:hypothetical protein